MALLDSSSSFIKRFDPEKIIISTDGKKYGHPSANALKRYISYDKNIDVYRTDRNGNIKIHANGNKWWIKTNKYSSQKVTATKPGSGSTSSGGSSGSTTKYVYANGGSSSSNKYHKSATAHGMKGAIKMSESSARKKAT